MHKLNCNENRLINYKLLHTGLPTNFKFNNRYDRECFMCKKKISEDLEHIFVKCEYTKSF